MATLKFSELDILVLEDDPMLRKRVTAALEGNMGSGINIQQMV